MLEDCEVPKALGMVLRLSRLAGVAPLQFQRRSDKLVIRYSYLADVYGRLLFGCVFLCTLTLIIWNVITAGDMMENFFGMKPVNMSFSISVAIMLFLGAYSIFRGRSGMKLLIENLNAVQKLNINKMHNQQTTVESRRITMITFYLIMLSILLWMDIWTVRQEYFNYNNFIRMILYCYGYTTMVLSKMQFVLVVFEVQMALQAVNQQLKDLATELRQSVCHATRSPERTIRQVADTYSSLCDIVRNLNNRNSISLLITLALFLIFFGISGFLLVMNLSNHPNSILGNKNSSNMFDIALQVSWCIFHCISVTLLIEPCHQTGAEIQTTKLLMNRIMYIEPSFSGPLCNELEMFFRLIVANDATYSPLSLCTLERALVIKMICGVISYLVIILQLDIKD